MSDSKKDEGKVQDVGHASFVPYPEKLGDSVPTLISLLRGDKTVGRDCAAHAAYHVLGFGLGQVLPDKDEPTPQPIVLPDTPPAMQAKSNAELISMLEKCPDCDDDQCDDGDDTSPEGQERRKKMQAIDWKGIVTELLPVILRIISLLTVLILVLAMSSTAVFAAVPQCPDVPQAPPTVPDDPAPTPVPTPKIDCPCGSGYDCGCGSGLPCQCQAKVRDGWKWDAKEKYWWKKASEVSVSYTQPTVYVPPATVIAAPATLPGRNSLSPASLTLAPGVARANVSPVSPVHCGVSCAVSAPVYRTALPSASAPVYSRALVHTAPAMSYTPSYAPAFRPVYAPSFAPSYTPPPFAPAFAPYGGGGSFRGGFGGACVGRG